MVGAKGTVAPPTLMVQGQCHHNFDRIFALFHGQFLFFKSGVKMK